LQEFSWVPPSIFLMWLGYAIFIIGIISVLLALTCIRKIRFGPYKYVMDCSPPHRSASSQHDVKSFRQDIELSWKEQEGKEVICSIRERILPLSGLGSKMYAQERGTEGSLSCSLSEGAYLIHFESTDQEPRKVAFEVKGTEHKPLKEYLPIGLTLLTIGTVLAVNGLSILLRG